MLCIKSITVCHRKPQKQSVILKGERQKSFAVGTTVVRTLEAMKQMVLIMVADIQKIFIYPGYEFKVVDAIITNFHLPESTLLMLVSAFAGKEKVLAAYQ